MIVHQACRFASNPALAWALPAHRGAVRFARASAHAPVVSRRRSRPVSRAEFRQQEYEARRLGSCLVVAARWSPSSKIRSDPGAVKAGLTPLKPRRLERAWRPPEDPLHVDWWP
ncbi:hypothetical protein [Lentzea californiensis]|uniref:hypothetical protein n=1 Tax=Lentzea californiensis TaxID=438851 RepID=UPI00216572E4|nr:hypothetical protein [Lentzea californiensis]